MTRRFTSTHPSTPLAKASIRVAVDSLVQGALVELFNAHGVAVAPLPRTLVGRPGVPDVSVVATFKQSGVGEGRLTLSMPSELVDYMNGSAPTSVRLDRARELTNQLIGRIKNRLLPLAVRLEIGLLSLLDPKLLQHQLQDLSNLRAYEGRTLRGSVLVTIQGLPPDSTLAYVGAAAAPEGSMLWL